MALRLRNELPLVLIASLLAAALVGLAAPLVLRLPLGLVAVLILPGYSLSVLLFPRADDLDGVERLALSFGASLGLVTVLALALSYTPWGLAPTAIVLALTGWTALATLAAWWRRRALPPRAYVYLLPDLPRLWRQARRPARAIALMAAGALALAAAALTVTLSEPPAPSTEFYVLGREGLAQDYPRVARSGEVVSFAVGLTNREGRAAGYHVVAEVDGNRVAEAEAPHVAPGESWETPVQFEMPAGAGERAVDLLLYKDGGTQPYRQLRLWLTAALEGPTR